MPDRSDLGRSVAASFGLPHPSYLRTVARNTVLLWVLGRLLVFAVLWPTVGLEIALHPNAATRGLLIAVAALLVHWDRVFAHELLLPANLGGSPGWFWAASIGVGWALDLTVQALLVAL